ncbi:MAG: DUF642 domain-containing protein [Cytophagaceae bacterium]|nr:MAG: DUF642 domain-containing protein [Cytophagaceae bacterium]
MLAVLLISVSTSQAHAQNLQLNGSFEIAGASADKPQSWAFSGSVDRQQYTGGSTAGFTDGSYSLVFGSGNSSHGGFLQQTITTVAGQTYRLQFDYGKYGTGTASSAQMLRVIATGNGGVNMLTQVITDDTGSPYDISANPSLPFTSYSYFFTASGTAASISFQDASTSSDADNADGVLDNVRVFAVVPEANTGALLGPMLPILGTLTTVRRRNQQK